MKGRGIIQQANGIPEGNPGGRRGWAIRGWRYAQSLAAGRRQTTSIPGHARLPGVDPRRATQGLQQFESAPGMAARGSAQPFTEFEALPGDAEHESGRSRLSDARQDGEHCRG